jgi:ribosomal protein S8
MSQDVVADALNQIMNAKLSRKNSVYLKRSSRVLLSVLTIGKLRGYIKDYQAKGNEIKIELSEVLNACKAVKPRYVVKVRDLDKYIRRYLPARNMGVLIISTNKGLMTHQTAIEQKKGGSIIAYFY